MPCKCDVPRCTGTRARFHRLCARCFKALPDHIKIPLAAAKRERRVADWRKLRREAGDFMNLPDPLAVAIEAQRVMRVPPEAAFAATQRLLGERPDQDGWA